MGIRCIQKKKFKATTDSKHTLPVAENLLNQQFKAAAPNRIWLTDITYIATEEGWLYLAGHKDVFTGGIVGYAMGPRMTKNLVSPALFRAVAAKGPVPGLIHHSDRGSQYLALHEYRRLLDQFHMRASMSRKGDCYDNAPMESFWGTLKNELVHHRRYGTKKRPSGRLVSTSRSSITGRGGRQDWAISPLLPYERQFYEMPVAA